MTEQHGRLQYQLTYEWESSGTESTVSHDLHIAEMQSEPGTYSI